MHVEKVPISSLVFDPANARKHGTKNLEAIKGSLTRFGQQKPIVVDEKGVVLAGNGTLAAAKELGWTDIEVHRTALTGSDKTAFAIADNRTGELAEWDMDNLGAILKDLDTDLLKDIGFDAKDLEKLMPELVKEGLCDEDEVPEVTDTRCKPGDLWQLGNHRLLCGDSTNVQHVERLMGGEKADMVFTDPPYGDNHAAMDVDPTGAKNGKSLVTKSHKLKNDENLDFLPGAVAACFGVVKSNATKMLFFKWKKWNEILQATESWGEPSAVCVWDRDDIAAAVMRFNPSHEFCFHWGSQLDKHSTSNLRNVWRCKKEYENKVLHPTVKPIEILQPAIEVCTDRSAIVLDLFLGSGSTLIACEKTNRRCFGMEIDPHYCSVILARWEKFTGQQAKLLST